MKQAVSIIIPTFHRTASLGRILKSLAKEIDKNSTEVIVVVQGEVQKRTSTEGNVRYVYLPGPSMAHARNVGARTAKGDLLLFLDDDVTVRPDLIKIYTRNFSDPKVAAVCGRVLTTGQKIEDDNNYVGRVGWLGQVSGGYSSTVKQEIDTVIGCNMCWRRSTYLKLGGVDEQFTGNALREETDLSLRAKKLGYKIIFEPKAIVDHHREPTGGARKTEGRLQWYYDFFSNETYYFLKHRPGILLPIYLLSKSVWAARCMFGFGREVSIRSLITPAKGILSGIDKYGKLPARRGEIYG